MANVTAIETAAERIGFVPEPDGRGTIGLVHACISTLLLCTWSAMHLNLPADDEGLCKVVLRRFKWTLVAIVAPELIASLALRERLEVSWLAEQILQWQRKGITSEDVELQDSTKPINAGLGHHSATPSTGSEPSSSTQRAHPTWTNEHCFLLRMGGFTLLDLYGHRRRMNPDQFLRLLKAGFLTVPETAKADIEDKSKADYFLKAFACIQFVWFAVQLFARVNQHLPVTALEISTLAVVCCTVFTYTGWWNKPQDVATPLLLHFRPNMSEEDGIAANREISFGMERYRYGAGRRVSLMDPTDGETPGLPMFVAIFALPALAFGACHLAAWCMAYDTKADLILWRTGSVLCIALPLLVAFLTWIGTSSEQWEERVNVAALGTGAVYILARLCLIVEALIGLRSVSPGVYQTVAWSNYLPHLA